jgi:hypothetical protein
MTDRNGNQGKIFLGRTEPRLFGQGNPHLADRPIYCAYRRLSHSLSADQIPKMPDQTCLVAVHVTINGGSPHQLSPMSETTVHVHVGRHVLPDHWWHIWTDLLAQPRAGPGHARKGSDEPEASIAKRSQSATSGLDYTQHDCLTWAAARSRL